VTPSERSPTEARQAMTKDWLLLLEAACLVVVAGVDLDAAKKRGARLHFESQPVSTVVPQAAFRILKHV
jgi:hypothetical protein